MDSRHFTCLAKSHLIKNIRRLKKVPILKGSAALKAIIYFWTIFYSNTYGVDPAFALAVAHIESRTHTQEFRTGLLCNKWYGPYNIHKDFKHRWPNIDTIQGNCQVGVMALRGSSPRKILKKYNAEFNEAYYQEIMKATKMYKEKLNPAYQNAIKQTIREFNND